MSVLVIMEAKLAINFTYPCCLAPGSIKGFTNYLSGEDEFLESIAHIISKMIPEISSKNLGELKSIKQYHTHPLNDAKKNFAISIFREIVKNYFGYTGDEAEKWINNQGIYMEQLWQISCPDSNGIRIIGYPKGDIFNILFIDYYHMLEPDQKHNQSNIEAHSFSVFEYIGGKS